MEIQFKKIRKKVNIDILGLAETNLNWECKSTKQQCLLAMKDKTTNMHTKIEFSSCTQPTHMQQWSYLPGGKLTMIRSPWTSRASTTTDNSNMGQWTKLTLNGPNSH
jgi:hypothetical protein